MTSFPTQPLPQMGVVINIDPADVVQQDNNTWANFFIKWFNPCLCVESEECCGAEVRPIPARDAKANKVFMTCCPGAVCNSLLSPRFSSEELAGIRMRGPVIYYDPKLTEGSPDNSGSCCEQTYTWKPFVGQTVAGTNIVWRFGCCGPFDGCRYFS